MRHCSNGPVRDHAHAVQTLGCLVNGRERALPLSHVHPERFIDLSTVADLNRRNGGLNASAVEVTTSLVQIALQGLDDSERAACRAREVAEELWRVGAVELPSGCDPGLEVRSYGAGQVVISLYVEHAGGFGIVEPAARRIAPELARLLGASVPPCFAIGTVARRRVRVAGAIDVRALEQSLSSAWGQRPPSDGHDGSAALSQVFDRLTRAAHAPDIAFELNARVLSGLCAASAIFGAASDFLQAEGQTHAARRGGCDPFVRWRRQGHSLLAELDVPVALQRVSTVVNAAEVETACDIAGVANTRQLELACASVGLLASFAGLRSDLRAAHAARPADPAPLGARPAAPEAPSAHVEDSRPLLESVVLAKRKQRHHAA